MIVRSRWSAGVRFGVVLCAMGSLPLLAQTVPLSSVTFSNEVEGSLVRTLLTLKDGGITPALKEIDEVLAKNPHFRLGHMIRGDLLMAKSGAPVALSDSPAGNRPEAIASIANLRHEAQVRFTRYFDAPPTGYLPTALLKLAPSQTHALIVDSAKSRIYVFRNDNGQPQLVTDFYISRGKAGLDKTRQGDQRTPLGVYHVTSAVPKGKLSDFYGPGAFPINFPNEMDRRLGRTGSGIWLHGTPSDTYSRPPLASDGCVVLTNEDFARISTFIAPGSTPVVIVPNLEWRAPAEWGASNSAFDGYLSQWKRDWESLNADTYLSHYSKKFDADGKDYADWSAHKRRVNAGKTYVKVEIKNLSVFEYVATSNQPPMMMVTFDQDYKSSNNAARMKKRQYWQREDGHWKIVYEAAVT